MSGNNPIGYNEMFTPDAWPKFIANLEKSVELTNTLVSGLQKIAAANATILTKAGGAGGKQKTAADYKSEADAMEKIEIANKGIDEAEKKRAATLKILTVEQQKQKILTAEANRESKVEAQLATAKKGSYQQLTAQLAKLDIEYKKINLSNKNLTAQEKETISSRAKLKQQLIDLDATQNVYGRNVGNYTGTIQKLGKGIGGLSELLGTLGGVLGIDTEVFENFEAIGKTLIKTTKELHHTTELAEVAHEENAAAIETETAAVEENTVATEENAVAQEAAEAVSPASWVALAIVGIAALTAVIYEWTRKENEAEIATKGIADTIGDFNTGASTAIEKVTKVKAVFKEAKDGVIDKKKALEEYNTTLGGTLGYATDLNEAEQIMLDKVPSYIKAQGLKAQADALFKKAAEAQAEGLSAGLQDQTTWWDKVTAGISNFGDELDLATGTLDKNSGLIKDLQADQHDRVQTIVEDKNKEADVYTKLATAMLEQADALDNANGITDDAGKKAKETTTYVNEEREAYEGLRDAIKQYGDLEIVTKLTAMDLTGGQDPDAAKKALDDNVKLHQAAEQQILDDLKVKLNEQLISQKDYDAAVLKAKQDSLKQQIADTKALLDQLDPMSSNYNEALADQFDPTVLAEIKTNYADMLKDLSDATIENNKTISESNRQTYEDEISQIKDMNNAILTGLNDRNDAYKEYLKMQSDDIQSELTVQQNLFNQGLDNNLAYEKQERAEARENELKLARKAAKEKRAIEIGNMYVDYVQAYLKSDNPQGAAQKALAQTLITEGIADAISGKYFDGTEDTGVGGNMDSKGGMLSILHPHERVIKRSDNERLGEMSNSELIDYANLGWEMENIYRPQFAGAIASDALGGRANSDMALMMEINNMISQGIEKGFSKITIHNTSIDAQKRLIEEVTKQGMRQTINHSADKNPFR